MNGNNIASSSSRQSK